MVKKYIELLQAQIIKLDAKGFDLQAWKNYTIVLLARIFGEDNQKIKQIEKIEYDYSSWALRDTSGHSSYMITCKKLGKEILEASIDELKNFGLPEKKDKEKDNIIDIDTILTAMEDLLKISQFKEVKKILNSKESSDIKKKLLKEKLNSFGSDIGLDILINILVNPQISEKF